MRALLVGATLAVRHGVRALGQDHCQVRGVQVYSHLQGTLNRFAPHPDHGVHGRVPGDLRAEGHQTPGPRE